jgi:DedD protein
MDREQKKLLLVAVSVGVFLLVTITVAIIMLTPKAQLAEAGFTSSTVIPSGGIQPVDIISNIPPAQEIITSVPDSFGTAVAVDSNNGDSLTIQVPTPSTAAVPDNTDIPETTAGTIVTVAPPRVRQTPAGEPAAATTPRPAAAATTKPAATSTPATAPRPAAATTTRPAAARTVNDYWIQTGAFKALVRAEDAKELLSSKGLTSLIDTRVVNGETYYRVRLGPYTSEREANNWLTLVKSIDGFSNSQIRQSTRIQ